MKFRLPISIAVFFLSFVSPVFAQQVPPIVISPPPNVISDIGKLISSLFSILLIIAGLLAFFYLLFGGIQWITSGGDKAGLEAAKNKIMHAIIGLIIVFSTWAIMLLLQSFLGRTILGPIDIPTPF